MQQLFRVEQKILLDGSRLPQLVRDTGFVDIKVNVIKFEIGAWGPGFTLL
jgi:hypothetical protein